MEIQFTSTVSGRLWCGDDDALYLLPVGTWYALLSGLMDPACPEPLRGRYIVPIQGLDDYSLYGFVECPSDVEGYGTVITGQPLYNWVKKEANADPMEGVPDELMITALTRRGYLVSRA